MKYTRYIINVLEPKQQYLLDFVDLTLNGCKKQAEQYLAQCPQGTDYMAIQAVYTKTRQTKYPPKQHPTGNVVVNIGDLNENN